TSTTITDGIVIASSNVKLPESNTHISISQASATTLIDKTSSTVSSPTEEISEFETTTVRFPETTIFPESSSSSSSEEYVDMFLTHPHHFTQSAALKQPAIPHGLKPGQVVPATRPIPTNKPIDGVSKPYHET